MLSLSSVFGAPMTIRAHLFTTRKDRGGRELRDLIGVSLLLNTLMRAGC
jgi:hypothetical protein